MKIEKDYQELRNKFCIEKSKNKELKEDELSVEIKIISLERNLEVLHI
jgi:hypothetical protein